MSKIIELVIIAIFVGLASSGLFEVIKNRFLRFGALGKSATIIGLLVFAVILALLDQIIPDFEEVHFTFPIPVPALSQYQVQAKQVVLTAQALVLCVSFGLFVAVLSVTDTRKQILAIDELPRRHRPPQRALLSAFINSPLFLYPVLGLLYKVVIIPQPQPSQSFITVCLLAFIVLGALLYKVLARPLWSISHWLAVIALTVVLAAIITIAAVF
jgi:hypothetical protein